YNLGNALHALGRFDEALASYDRAVVLNPGYAKAFNDRGITLHGLGLLEAALASYDRAIELEPASAIAHNNRATILTALKRLDESLSGYELSVALKPDYSEAHFNLALARLRIGDFERGWEELEWRWGTDWFQTAARNFEQPLWSGRDDLAGKSILLHAEQGFG